MNLKFKWIGGATCIISFDGIKIAIDPVLCKKGTVQDYFWFKSKRLENPIYDSKDFKDIHLWLITHNHEDHLDNKGLKVIQKDAIVISNKNSLKKLQNKQLKKSIILSHHQEKKVIIKNYSITIKAIPAIHGINPLSALFAGKVNGYLITIQKDKTKKTIYFTSDTVYKKKVIRAVANQNIDLLIPNMGAAKQGTWIMTLTLNAKMLSKMALQLKPKHIVPVHFGTFEHYNEPISEIKKYNIQNLSILKVGDEKDLIL